MTPPNALRVRLTVDMNTKVIKISEINKTSLVQLEEAAEIIKNGGLVVFPTETVYGLGADATNPLAVESIYTAKGRPGDNPLIIHIADPKDAEGYAYVNDTYYRLADKFMPGPLTVILKSKDIIPKKTRAGLETVAVRCPDNSIAQTLIRLSGVPIAAPSANLSGSPSPTKASHVIDDMTGRVDVIIDGGDADFGLESTIVLVNGEDSLTLLRPGKITKEELLTVCQEVKVADAVTDELKDGEKALSPGMKYRHYAPRATLLLLDGERDAISEFLKKDAPKSSAIICYEEDTSYFDKEIPSADIYSFGKKEDEITQAHKLFALLREVDKKSYDKIYAPLPKKQGVGLALYNRMIRAAAHQIIKL